MEKLRQYQTAIKGLSPADQGFVYNKGAWTKTDTIYMTLAADFENNTIKRSDIIQAFREYKAGDSGSWVKPFLFTMIWGFGPAGYGDHRTNNYFTGGKNQERIQQAFEAVERHDIQAAFQQLRKINGLGVSFLSKLLYFAGKAKGMECYPLIFDRRVANALVKIYLPDGLKNVVVAAPSDKWEDYEAYYLNLHEIAGQLDVEADQLEMFLYGFTKKSSEI